MSLNLGTQQAAMAGQLILSIAAVLLLGLLAYLLIRRGVNLMYRRSYISESARGVFYVVLRWTMLVLIGLLVLQQIGVQLTSVWAALSATVVLLGAALVAVWSVASNIFCSLLLLVFRPFSIGDDIELIEPTGGPGLGGKVVNLNLIYTYLLEEGENGAGGTIVEVPNNIFFQKSIRRKEGGSTRSLENFIFKDDTQSVKQNISL